MEIDNFLTYLSKSKNASKHTIVAYASDLHQFEQHLSCLCQGNTEDKNIDLNIIRIWIMDMADKGITNRSIARKLTALRTYFFYKETVDKDTKNPMNKIVAPKIAKRKMSFISEQEIKKLLNEQYNEEDFLSLRDKLIIELLYATGVRRSELINIKQSDISFERECIKVMGKRKKERMVPVNKKIVADLIKYIDLKQRLNIKETVLFVDKKGKPMSVNSLYYMVHKKLENYDVNKKSPHVFRHTCATHLVGNGAELNNVKTLMGHASVATTELYTHTTLEQLKQEYKKAFQHIN